MQEEQAAHQGCRVKHGRQRGTAQRGSHGCGQRERKGEKEKATAEEAQGHSPLVRNSHGGQMDCFNEN